MGAYISKLFINICDTFKYCSCRSHCCRTHSQEVLSVEIDNNHNQKDVDTDINCCYGCFVLHKKTNIHDTNKQSNSNKDHNTH